MARPGIMLYFDIRQPLKVLPDADKGRLFDAILEYGEYGTIPEFDGMLAMAWGFIQPKLDRDSAEYNRTVLKRQYATFCRELKRKGAAEVSFENWMELSDDERKLMISHDANRYPTTTSAVTPTTKSTATSAVAVTETTKEGFAAADRKMKIVRGELGRGVVFLSDAQISSLLEKLDLDAFDYYVDKLANFIIKNDAKVKNHYETILKWWREDSSVGSEQSDLQRIHTKWDGKMKQPANGSIWGSMRLGNAEYDAIRAVLAQPLEDEPEGNGAEDGAP